MEVFRYDIFNVDIKEMTVLELREWLLGCRNYIPYSDGEVYLERVFDFCEEWKRHYGENQTFYKSPKFKKALLSLALPLPKLFLATGSQKKAIEDITNKAKSVESFFSIKWIDRTELSLKRNSDKYEKMISDCFNDKTQCKRNLDDIINHLTKTEENVCLKVFKDKKILNKSFEEMLEALKSDKNLKIETVERRVVDRKLDMLKEYGISRTVFLEYMNINTCERDFDKKFFVNLAFLLSLDYSKASKLLEYNGYSISDSNRSFDNIVKDAFKIGFGRNYTIVLITKYNQERPKYADIPNLTTSPRVKTT